MQRRGFMCNFVCNIFIRVLWRTMVMWNISDTQAPSQLLKVPNFFLELSQDYMFHENISQVVESVVNPSRISITCHSTASKTTYILKQGKSENDSRFISVTLSVTVTFSFYVWLMMFFLIIARCTKATTYKKSAPIKCAFTTPSKLIKFPSVPHKSFHYSSV